MWRKFVERLPPMNYPQGVVPEAAATAAIADAAEDEAGTAVVTAEPRPIRAIDMLTEDDFAELSLWEAQRARDQECHQDGEELVRLQGEGAVTHEPARERHQGHRAVGVEERCR